MADQTSFPTLLEAFFTRRLIAQRRASRHTVASYRDTFRLLFQFAEKRLAKVLNRRRLTTRKGSCWRMEYVARLLKVKEAA